MNIRIVVVSLFFSSLLGAGYAFGCAAPGEACDLYGGNCCGMNFVCDRVCVSTRPNGPSSSTWTCTVDCFYNGKRQFEASGVGISQGEAANNAARKCGSYESSYPSCRVTD